MSTIAHWTRRFKSAIGRSESVRTVLDPERVEHWCREAGHTWRRSFWSPGPTLLCSLLQALNASKSLRAGVADLLSHLVATDPAREIPSADPSAFAQARRRLPERVFDSVLRETAGRAAALAGDDRRWRGRRVVVVDGTCVSMPDEPELQDAFPQPEAQAAGCGFPVARATALFCWGTGVVLDLRIGSLRDSELGLFRDMLDRFGPGDVVLADRHYCSYVDIARLRERGADVVLRLHQRRSTDFRQGTRLGPEDRLVAWRRPKRWPPRCGLSREQFEALPEEMTLRMVRTTRTPKGFRSREIVLVTTILDPEEASTDDLLALYGDRWTVELNLRSLKQSLGMEVLRGRSVDVVRKELLVHATAYNLIRILMWEAARASGRDVRRLSFAGTLDRLRRAGPLVLAAGAPRRQVREALALVLACVSRDLVPARPERFEPRRVKRRPKGYSRLTKPRAHYRRHGDPECR